MISSRRGFLAALLPLPFLSFSSLKELGKADLPKGKYLIFVDEAKFGPVQEFCKAPVPEVLRGAVVHAVYDLPDVIRIYRFE